MDVERENVHQSGDLCPFVFGVNSVAKDSPGYDDFELEITSCDSTADRGVEGESTRITIRDQNLGTRDMVSLQREQTEAKA